MKGYLALSGVLATTAFTSLTPIVTATPVTPVAARTARVTPPVVATPVVAKHIVTTRLARRAPTGARGISNSALTGVVKSYCGSCHSATQKRGNLSLAGYSVDSAVASLDVTEKMIRKLRAQMMPPPGSRRPTGDTLLALVEALEGIVDASGAPNPGSRTFSRLNRPEYERAIKDLLKIQVTAGDFLPLDTKSANFDNIADVQAMSPTLLEAYLNAASAVSRMAVGDKRAVPAPITFKSSLFESQHPWDHIDGTPYGTRGGMVFLHTFPADAEYTFRLNVAGGTGMNHEDLVLSIDGNVVSQLKYEKGMDRHTLSADYPNGFDFVRSEPLKIKGGQHTVAVAFVRRTEGPYEDLIKPHDWSRASGATAAAGTTEPSALADITINGPMNITGLSNSPSRQAIFTCHPTAKAAQRACAQQIVTRLATSAYRREVTPRDVSSLMGFYDRAVAQPGNDFEDGVRTAIQATLASPYFVFRFEKTPANAVPGSDVRLTDYELATRLSFFLWGTIPDARLLSLARQKQLQVPATFSAEVRRMLADERANALSTRFAAQWLRLQDIEKVHPDAFLFPDYDLQLATSMQTETELFFEDLIRRDASVMDLFSADYTFVNERLAKHYGIPDVAGNTFRKVSYPDASRRGIFGQGSMLVQTSLGNRTSPVLRGKWVMEVLMGAPPPAPPPNIPDLEQTAGSVDGKAISTRQRMEMHRSNPTCKSCHQFIDPIGLALDNFDVTGRVRYRENGATLDTRGQMYDGRQVTSAADLIASLTSRPIPLMRNFTENLMAYAVGRRMEDYDQSTIRTIVRDAAKTNYKFSSLVMGVVNSKAFRTKRIESVSADDTQH
ncbi:MAG: DUF1592 domain-containing protein [Gemmatimonadaceae bacterium]